MRGGEGIVVRLGSISISSQQTPCICKSILITSIQYEMDHGDAEAEAEAN